MVRQNDENAQPLQSAKVKPPTPQQQRERAAQRKAQKKAQRERAKAAPPKPKKPRLPKLYRNLEGDLVLDACGLEPWEIDAFTKAFLEEVGL